MAAVTRCPSCGHENPLSAHFCSSCGTDLSAGDNSTTVTVTLHDGPPSQETEVELGDLTSGIGMLVVTRGPNSGSRFALDEAVVTAGRHPDSVIFLDDVTVSRRHAEIRRGDEGYTLFDVGSLNGTYLNRERVDEAPLRDGDELQIGTFKLLFIAGRR